MKHATFRPTVQGSDTKFQLFWIKSNSSQAFAARKHNKKTHISKTRFSCLLPFLCFLSKSINFSLKVNDELVQSGNSKNMLFSFNRIVSEISKYFALNIGDLVFTGTPAGVGECVVGDQLEAFYEDKSVLSLEIK